MIAFPLTGNSLITINSSALHKQENKIVFSLPDNPPVATNPHTVHTQSSHYHKSNNQTTSQQRQLIQKSNKSDIQITTNKCGSWCSLINGNIYIPYKSPPAYSCGPADSFPSSLLPSLGMITCKNKGNGVRQKPCLSNHLLTHCETKKWGSGASTGYHSSKPAYST